MLVRTFTDGIKKKGFEQSHADPCVFRRIVDGEVVTVIVVYADDILLASKTKEDEGRTLSDPSSCFKIKDLGEAEFYLGCHITRNREAMTLTFDQHIYAVTVAKRFNVTKTSMIPMATGVKPLPNEDGPKNLKEREEMRRIPYREAVGALMWVATMTKPDISFAAHNLAKFCDDPGPVHWKAAMKALRYFWRTKDHLWWSYIKGFDNVSIRRLRSCNMPGQPTFGLRGGSYAGRWHDKLVLTCTEGNSVGVIRVGVCGASGNRE